jgi:hypothetical protein
LTYTPKLVLTEERPQFQSLVRGDKDIRDNRVACESGYDLLRLCNSKLAGYHAFLLI